MLHSHYSFLLLITTRILLGDEVKVHILVIHCCPKHLALRLHASGCHFISDIRKRYPKKVEKKARSGNCHLLHIWPPRVTHWQHHSQWLIYRKQLWGWSHLSSFSESLQVRWEEGRMVGRSPCIQIDQTFNSRPPICSGSAMEYVNLGPKTRYVFAWPIMSF